MEESEATITVWSFAKGDFFRDIFTALLYRGFPRIKGVVWTKDLSVLHGPNTWPVCILTHFNQLEHDRLRGMIPLVTWSAESYRYKWIEHPTVNVVASLEDLRRTDLYIPQLFLRPLPLGTPPSFRLHSDDINRRPYAAVYITKNCKPEREAAFHGLLRALGAGLVKARGECSNNAPMPAGSWKDAPLLDALREAKLVLTLENKNEHGYVTEKLMNAFLAGAVPVHWGGKGFAKLFFNPKAYIDLEDYPSLEAGIADVVALAQSPARLAAMRREPVFPPGRQQWMNEVFRWDQNNASAFSVEAAHVRAQLLQGWQALADTFASAAAAAGTST